MQHSDSNNIHNEKADLLLNQPEDEEVFDMYTDDEEQAQFTRRSAKGIRFLLNWGKKWRGESQAAVGAIGILAIAQIILGFMYGLVLGVSRFAFRLPGVDVLLVIQIVILEVSSWSFLAWALTRPPLNTTVVKTVRVVSLNPLHVIIIFISTFFLAYDMGAAAIASAYSFNSQGDSDLFAILLGIFVGCSGLVSQIFLYEVTKSGLSESLENMADREMLPQFDDDEEDHHFEDPFEDGYNGSDVTFYDDDGHDEHDQYLHDDYDGHDQDDYDRHNQDDYDHYDPN